MNKIVLSGAAVIAILLGVALGGYMTGGWNVGSEYYGLASAEPELMISKYDDRFLQLEREAADNAYRRQIEHLFDIWMRDPTGQPARAATGAQIARKAYIDVMKAIDNNEQKLHKLRELSPGN